MRGFALNWRLPVNGIQWASSQAESTRGFVGASLMAQTLADNRSVPPAFRYFELVDEVATRYGFWEIRIDGPRLEVRHGPVGTAGKHETETFSSEELAAREYQLRIAAHLDDGYREVADRRLDARTRDLEAAIEADLEDVTAYLVYADWIQTLGDPRGALIVAQASGDATASATLLKQYESTFLGPLAEHVGYDGSIIDATWRNGFIRRALLRVDGTPRVTRVFEQLLEHPSARWLGELAIQTVDDLAGLQPIADILASRRCPSITTLELGEVGELRDPDVDEDDPSYYWHRDSTDLSGVWANFPALRRLAISGDPDRLGELDLPALTELEVRVCALSADDVRAIAGVTGPLERLELRFAWPLAENLAEQLGPILRSPMLRGLDHLAIAGDRTRLVGSDRLCEAIANLGPLSLRTLDLSHGRMTDAGAESLAASRLALDIIDVSNNALLSYRGVTSLERIATLVIR
jgi:uncharacterized protein (TIGR02996 family)